LTLMYLAGEEMDLRKWDDFPQEQDVSFADWAALNEVYDHPYVKGVVRALSTALVGREPDEVGAQYLLDYVKAGQGMESLGMENSGGAQFLKIKQGESRATHTSYQPLCSSTVTDSTLHEKAPLLLPTDSHKDFGLEVSLSTHPSSPSMKRKATPSSQQSRARSSKPGRSS
jgi:hypothetical protein